MKTAKIKTFFMCQECGHESAKWLGKCPDCGKWNTFVEENRAAEKRAALSLTDFSSQVMPLKQITTENFLRIPTKISEFDRIVGGGVVPGSIVLLGGPPGIGKSTLMLQVSSALSRNIGGSVLYVSGEESLAQIKSRADRLKISSDSLYIVSETNLENIISAIDKVSPKALVIDSIQTAYRADLPSAPGSVGQVRECAAEFLRVAKSKNIAVFLLGHVTKEGDIAGPRILEHIVDTVLYFETERQQIYRILRVYKNRFGPTSEIGVFEMQGSGLQEVTNPSQIFLGERTVNSPGNIVTATIEGTRPLLLEVQALVTRTNFGLPRRMVAGYDTNRVSLLIAVLEKRLGLHLETQDIFINVVGGIKLKETGVDLAIAGAIASGHSGFVCPKGVVIIGELGLSGEVRSVNQIAERITESEKLGFEKAIIPKSNLKKLNYKGGIKITGVENIDETIKEIRQ